MGIYIRGMEMPTGCGATTINVWSDGQVEIINTDGEWETSEAVPVAEWRKWNAVQTKPVTNYDLLIRKTPEEMAAWIADHPVVSEYDENNPQHKAWLDWLKQEVANDP